MKKQLRIKRLKYLPYKHALSKMANADLMIHVDMTAGKQYNFMIALRYDSAKDMAPVVVFKGSGEHAVKKLEEIAKNNGILVSRSFHLNMKFGSKHTISSSSIGNPIYEDCYPALAKAYACILKMKQYYKDQNLYEFSELFDSYLDAAISRELPDDVWF